MERHDLAVIGAGAAGLTVAAAAAQLGLRVALIERGRMGGECLNTGCVPSKALLASAGAVRAARHAAALGIGLGPARVDWTAVQAHVQGVIAAIAPMDGTARLTALGARVIAGTARFIGRDRLDVSGHGPLAARRIVIAAGSVPVVPAIPGLDALPFLTAEQLFALPEPPGHLLILGGGAMGLEMAQAHAALGCRVTLLEAGRVAPAEDPELADGLRRTLAHDGVTVIEEARAVAAEPGPVLVLADGTRIAGTHLLLATGRRPALEALDLEAGGVRATARGIATDAGLRSLSNRRVFACGDIADPAGIGPRAFTHAAGAQAGVVVRRAVFRLPARFRADALPRVTYTEPELAQVGLTETEARARGLAVTVLRWPLAENDRAQAERRPEGLVKLVVGRRGRLLGAGILAPHAGEMIGLHALAIARGLGVGTLAGLVLPYPTRAEAAKRAAARHFTALAFNSALRRALRWLARLP